MRAIKWRDLAVKPLVEAIPRLPHPRLHLSLLITEFDPDNSIHRRLFCLRRRVNGKLFPFGGFGEATKSIPHPKLAFSFFSPNFAENNFARQRQTNRCLGNWKLISVSCDEKGVFWFWILSSPVSAKGYKLPGEVQIKFDSRFDKPAKVAKRKKNGQSVGLIFWEIRKWQHVDCE